MPDFFVAYYNTVSLAYEAIKGTNADTSFTGADGADANGLAAIKTSKSGKFVAFPIAGAAQASLTTTLVTVNSNLKFTAKALGTGGNSITVRYVVSGNNTPLSVSVSTNDITVNVATGAGGAATSTASQVLSAVNASAPAFALVVASLAPGNDGTGIVAAFPATALTAGTTGAAVATTTTVGVKADSVLTSF